jgi:hypothetical protein
MSHPYELEREAEKIALAEKLEGQLKTLIFDSQIPLKDIVRMLGADEFFEEVGKGDKKARVFHFNPEQVKRIQEGITKNY